MGVQDGWCGGSTATTTTTWAAQTTTTTTPSTGETTTTAEATTEEIIVETTTESVGGGAAGCEDKDEYCAEMVPEGFCEDNDQLLKDYMNEHCAASCNSCDGGVTTEGSGSRSGSGSGICEDKDEYCPDLVAEGFCEDTDNFLKAYMNEYCAQSYNVC